MSDAAITALNDFIARVRTLPELGRMVAPRAADIVRADLQKTIGASQAPDGTPHKRRKKDNQPALRDAAKALYVTSIGGSVYVRIVGPEAAHHLGRVTGKITRQLIPANTLPPAMAEHLVQAIQAEFLAVFGGANG